MADEPRRYTETGGARSTPLGSFALRRRMGRKLAVRLVATLLAAGLSAFGCGGDITGCGDEDETPADILYCGIVEEVPEVIDAAAPGSPPPNLPTWIPSRLTIPAGGIGWVGATVGSPATWAIVVRPPVPVEFDVAEPPVPEATIDLPCGARVWEFGPFPFDSYAIRIGPTAEREVTVGFWDELNSACY